MGVLKVLPQSDVAIAGTQEASSQWGHEQGRYPNAHILSEISEKLCDVVCVGCLTLCSQMVVMIPLPKVGPVGKAFAKEAWRICTCHLRQNDYHDTIISDGGDGGCPLMGW